MARVQYPAPPPYAPQQAPRPPKRKIALGWKIAAGVLALSIITPNGGADEQPETTAPTTSTMQQARQNTQQETRQEQQEAQNAPAPTSTPTPTHAMPEPTPTLEATPALEVIGPLAHEVTDNLFATSPYDAWRSGPAYAVYDEDAALYFVAVEVRVEGQNIEAVFATEGLEQGAGHKWYAAEGNAMKLVPRMPIETEDNKLYKAVDGPAYDTAVDALRANWR